MKKITFLMLHLSYGGIEKSVSDLANRLSKDYEIEIISTYKINSKPAFPINDNIKIKYLINGRPNRQEFKKSLRNFKLLKIFIEGVKALHLLYKKKFLMIKEIKKSNSNIIISSRTIHNKWLGKYAKKGIIKIAWEHNHYDRGKRYQKSLLKSIKKTDYFVLPLKEMYDFYKNKTNVKCVYIKHFINVDNVFYKKQISKNLISIGRLSKEKGYDLLIGVFHQLYQKNKGYKLDLIGDGPLREELETKISGLGLDKVIKMHGFKSQKEINAIIKKSSLYLMTSHTESFGLVLVESFSNSTPCIAFDSAGGAREIIKDGVNGFLIKKQNIDEMVSKIETIINNNNLYLTLNKGAFNSYKEYTWITVKNLWQKLFDD